MQKHDVSCVAYGNDNFFKRHNDFSELTFYPRRLTWIYYFFKEPKCFKGGDLVFFKGDREIARISPSSGLLVAFPSHVQHEATAVTLPNSHFEEYRFSITCFVTSYPSFLGAMRSTFYSLESRYTTTQIVTRPVLRGFRRVLRQLKERNR